MSEILLEAQAENRAVLLCLGALEPELAGEHSSSVDATWLRNARRLLDYARLSAWPVAHVFSAAQHGRMSTWQSVSGLAPLPIEPVFYRPARSAFSCPDCVEFIEQRRSDAVLLIGASFDACCLATAVQGVRAGRAIVVAEDATFAPQMEWDGIVGLSDIANQCGLGSLRVTPISRLTGHLPHFRVIRGGKG